MIEYLLINGVNDQPEDAEALIQYLRGLPVIVNLIPFNAIPFAPQWQPTPRDLRSEFANLLRKAGLFTTIRYSMGSDVQAACGQLVQSTAAAAAYGAVTGTQMAARTAR
jgi:23S rRNA (adenine2503-C2)-methyltransferase